MANGGWYGTEEEWNQIEAPLKEIDPILEDFADSNGLTITRNHKSWPERSMVWNEGIRCLIQIYLESGGEGKFTLWICASSDRSGKRHWKQEKLVSSEYVSHFKDDLSRLLSTGREKLLTWSNNPECLEVIATID